MYLISVLLIYNITGCSSQLEPKLNFKPPKYVEELPPKEDEDINYNTGSLFGRGENPLFTDRKAMKVNDILTVVISESTSASSTTQKNLSRANEGALGAGVFGGVAAPLNGITDLNFQNSSTSTYTGAGTMTRDEAFETTVTVRVIKVLNNGNYFIDGGRQLLINGEKQMVHISGVVSPYDIASDNTIDSMYISDAKILYTTQGDLKESTKRGWFSRFLGFLWPF
jgi:flagellar L-ring protein precursor FlgH